MGWTYEHCEPNLRAEIELVKGLFEHETEDLVQTPVYHTRRGNVHYLAVKTTRKAEGTSIVFGVVVLTTHDSEDYFNFGHREIDETEGPCYTQAPARLIRMLTPTDSEYANEWRKRCLENSRGAK